LRLGAQCSTGRGGRDARRGTHDHSPRDLLRLDLGRKANRVLTAVELVRRGLSPVLVLGGGSFEAPGSEPRAAAELLRDWLRDWGVVP
jgi:hypothetical protein